MKEFIERRRINCDCEFRRVTNCWISSSQSQENAVSLLVPSQEAYLKQSSVLLE